MDRPRWPVCKCGQRSFRAVAIELREPNNGPLSFRVKCVFGNKSSVFLLSLSASYLIILLISVRGVLALCCRMIESERKGVDAI